VNPLPIGVLASGTGTNFGAIADAIADGRLNAETRVLVCNRPGAPVLTLAVRYGVPTAVIDHRDFGSREAFDRAVADRLAAAGVELAVMAGFDRLVTSPLLERFPGRIVNVHPALLPAFKGVDAQTQAAEYGVRVAGATVHLVDAEVDHGPIIVQAAVAIAPGDDAETVRQRILEQEHRIYPYAVQLFAEGRIRVEGRRVLVDGCAPATPDALVSPPLPDGF
jgi:phosphoribosylglycinamide formyltransferase-1